MDVSTNILRILVVGLFFINSQAMIKNEQGSALPVAATHNTLENLTESIIEKIKKIPNLLFIKACPNRKPLVYDLCTKIDHAPLLQNLLTRKVLDKDAVLELTDEKYPLIILALAYRAHKNIQILLAAQPDLNITSTNPNAVLSICTPLSLAIENEDPESVEMVLHSYAIQQKKFQLPGLISKGIANASCDTVRLPLMQSVDRICMSNKRDVLLKIVEILLSHKADPNCKDAYGARLGNNGGTCKVDTPYELAEARRYGDVMNLFDTYLAKYPNSH